MREDIDLRLSNLLEDILNLSKSIRILKDDKSLSNFDFNHLF